MRAIAIRDFGGRDRLQLLNLPIPEPQSGEVLIRVKSAGVNPVDWKIREGLLKERLPHQFPIVLGWEAAGIIEACGECRRFQMGTEVFAYCRKPIVKDGAYAEYIAVPESAIAIKPKNMSFVEAACVPLAGLTAYQCLFEAAQLQIGESILIHAAAGGVGGFAVQLAKTKGARIIGTASSQNHKYLKELGVELAIDYTSENITRAVKDRFPDGVDVVMDFVGGSTAELSLEFLKPGGRLVTILKPECDPALLAERGATLSYVFVAPNEEQLSELAGLIESGAVHVRLSQVFPLEEAQRAHELSESGHVAGKIGLEIA